MGPVRRALGLLRRMVLRTVLLVIGPAAVAIGGFYFYMHSGRYVTTENAYVKAELIVVSAEVSGQVAEVAVKDNQIVYAGDILFRIDPERFEIERARRASRLSSALQEVESLKARLRAKQAKLIAAERDAEFLRTDVARTERLSSFGTIAETRLLEVKRLLAQAESAVEVARQEITEVLANLAGDPDLPADEHPDVLHALAELQEAEADLEAATVRAPRDAIAANLRLQSGEYVRDGDPILSLVSTEGFWIEANLKETELTHLRQGQAANFEIDAYPGVSWEAAVESLAPATGSEYALLPPQNASGNWVKVVQRIPVRLKIFPEPDAPELRAGMSARVVIDTEFERTMPEIVNVARAWVLPERP